jgi:hypothetical protein
MERDVRAAIARTRRAASAAERILDNPKRLRAETLEDALNELQDAGFTARRAFRVTEAR